MSDPIISIAKKKPRVVSKILVDTGGIGTDNTSFRMIDYDGHEDISIINWVQFEGPPRAISNKDLELTSANPLPSNPEIREILGTLTIILPENDPPITTNIIRKYRVDVKVADHIPLAGVGIELTLKYHPAD